MKTLINKVTMEWLKAAAIRAIRTMAQTALAMITVGASIGELDWLRIGSVAFVAGFASVLTSLATKLPEISTDGTLFVDANSNTDVFRFAFNNDPALMADKTHVALRVQQAPAILNKTMQTPDQATNTEVSQK